MKHKKETIEKMKLSNKNKVLRKGKTFEEIYGLEKANFLKLQLRKNRLGKKHSTATIVKMIQKRNTPENRLNNSIKHMGKKLHTNEKIVKRTLEELAKKPFTRTQFNERVGISHTTIQNRFGSMENFAKQYNIEFMRPQWNSIVGKIEQEAFSNYKQKNPNNIVIPQYSVIKYKVDWYDKTINTVFEFDEEHHKRQNVKDFIRQKEIENKLKCNFIRIDAREWLQQKQNNKLDSFVGEY